MPTDLLQNRALIAVTGEDASDFLQSIITTNVASIKPGEIWPGALLTPQGKILFEFLIGADDGSFQLETDAALADMLVKRLTLYRLRAKVSINRLEGNAITVRWAEERPDGALLDMRFHQAGLPLYRQASAQGPATGSYRALRIENGITGGAEDGPNTEYFPHDLLMDRNGGLDFKKGCYVGQEVVSRMQHRSTARRRPVIVEAETALPPDGAVLMAGEREIGAVLAATGTSAIAIARIDKAGAALASGETISVAGQPVRLTLPVWSGLEFPTVADESAP